MHILMPEDNEPIPDTIHYVPTIQELVNLIHRTKADAVVIETPDRVFKFTFTKQKELTKCKSQRTPEPKTERF